MGFKNKIKSFFIASPKQWILRIIFIVSVCTLVFSLSQILMWTMDNKGIADIEQELNGAASLVDIPDSSSRVPSDYWDFITTPFLGVTFDELISRNSDTVGWLQVGGTTVNYPVVQTSDNDFYLTHAFNKSSNAAGWLFADYRCNISDLGKNTIIYGHERMNATMFGSLKKMLDVSWFNNKENHLIRFATPTKSYVFQVFSVFITEPTTQYITPDFSSDNKWMNFLSEMKGYSIYDFGIDLTAKDKIITLSTCYGLEKRQVVMAKLVKEIDL